MTVIAAAIKNGQVSIAADTQSSLGPLTVRADYKKNASKLLEVNGNVIGMAGWVATSQIIEHLIRTKPDLFKLNNRWEIFETLLTLQKKLKRHYFLETSEDSDQPVESNQLDGLIINSHGIFSFASYREVGEYKQFWALGSGRRLALGAMHALYHTEASAVEIAEAGVRAAAEFDDGCSLPLSSVSLKLKQKANKHK